MKSTCKLLNLFLSLVVCVSHIFQVQDILWKKKKKSSVKVQRRKNMSKRGVQATFIFNIVKSISKKDIAVFDMFMQCRHQSGVWSKCLLGSDLFLEFTLALLLNPIWGARISFVAHTMLLRYCRIARILLFAHGMLLRLRMVSPHC